MCLFAAADPFTNDAELRRRVFFRLPPRERVLDLTAEPPFAARFERRLRGAEDPERVRKAAATIARFAGVCWFRPCQSAVAIQGCYLSVAKVPGDPGGSCQVQAHLDLCSCEARVGQLARLPVEWLLSGLGRVLSGKLHAFAA